MPFIIHHNDDDGRCSAAIIYNEIFSENALDANIPCIEYGHTGTLDFPFDELTDNDIIFIVDLCLDPVIYGFIQKVIDEKPSTQIVHIDHHQTSLDFIKTMDQTMKDTMSHVRQFYKVGISASMLCWVYACMTSQEREHCGSVVFDFTENYSHVGISEDGTMDHIREYRVPMIVRFIDDYDVWRHAMSSTKAFNLGFSIVEDKHPSNDLWKDLLYGQDFRLEKMFVEPGEIIQRYKTAENKRIMRNAFEINSDEHILFKEFGAFTMLCVNATTHTSLLFGDRIKDYDAVCVYHYDGPNNQWRYSMYSNEETGIDVSVICKKYCGGGHVHASGFQTNENIFTEIFMTTLS